MSTVLLGLPSCFRSGSDPKRPFLALLLKDTQGACRLVPFIICFIDAAVTINPHAPISSRQSMFGVDSIPLILFA